MDSLPVVSVVTGVYNAARYLSASAASILQQQGVSFEWIVIDDGSNDDSVRILDDLVKSDRHVCGWCGSPIAGSHRP